MTRTIHCAKLGTDAEGLDFAPWPGPLGQRIYAEISKPAWQQWLAHQTTLINEYRLNPLDPKVAQIPGRTRWRNSCSAATSPRPRASPRPTRSLEGRLRSVL